MNQATRASFKAAAAEEANIEEVALFPIPDLVAFPGTVIPLHVFEPRYRKMVHDCVESGRKIGVCHTVKEIRPAKKQQSKDEALNQNQATYQPQAVFSAGPCEIKDLLDDGRIQASIDMVGRYRLIEEVQTLPYRVVRAERLEDCDAEEDYSEQTQHITALLIELLGRQGKELAKILTSDDWADQTSSEFSNRLFQYIRFDAPRMQKLLELTSVVERLDAIERLLNGEDLEDLVD